MLRGKQTQTLKCYDLSQDPRQYKFFPLDRLSELTAGLVGPPGPPGVGRVGKTGKSGPRGPIGATFLLSMEWRVGGILNVFHFYVFFLFPVQCSLDFCMRCFVLTFRSVGGSDRRAEGAARTTRQLHTRTAGQSRTQRLPG